MTTDHRFNHLCLSRLTNASGTDHARVLAHLRRLSSEDQALRFGMAAVKDAMLSAFVLGLNFERDLFPAFEDAYGNVVGLAHAARYDVRAIDGTEHRAEVSFSVDPAWRGCGLGRQLMDACIATAADEGIELLVAQCVAANRPMRAVFSKGGWSMTMEDREVVAQLHLTLPRVGSTHLEALPAGH